MARYLVESPHTSEECLRTLDEVEAMGEDKLAQYDWGCEAGTHVGWINVEAESEAEALRAVPESIRGRAKAVELNKYTSEQIEAAHREVA